MGDLESRERKVFKKMETEMISVEINGKSVEVAKGSNILQAAKKANIKIPTLATIPT